MSKLLKSDLATESPQSETKDYYVSSKEINGITVIQAKKRSLKKSISNLLYTGKVWRYNNEYFTDVVNSLCKVIKEILYEINADYSRVLIIGLGNIKVTADSLGPHTINKLIPTNEKGNYNNIVTIYAPGVEGKSGIETFDIVQGLIKITGTTTVIIIDSLFARSTERLLSTIQISTDGIMPGSGVGNHKKEISEMTVGIPVLTIGVPTVTELPPFSSEPLYVTPNDIDIAIETMSKIIANGLEKSIYL